MPQVPNQPRTLKGNKMPFQGSARICPVCGKQFILTSPTIYRRERRMSDVNVSDEDTPTKKRYKKMVFCSYTCQQKEPNLTDAELKYITTLSRGMQIYKDTMPNKVDINDVFICTYAQHRWLALSKGVSITLYTILDNKEHSLLIRDIWSCLEDLPIIFERPISIQVPIKDIKDVLEFFKCTKII